MIIIQDEDFQDFDLGCPLDVLISALKDGIVAKFLDGTTQSTWNVNMRYHQDSGFVLFDDTYEYNDMNCDLDPGNSFEVLLSDYTKTWWLMSDLEVTKNLA